MTISIIVPVYNSEKHLCRCIDSILAQTYTNFELLLVNDGSKDNSGIICQEYAAKDFRIKVFHKVNGGVSSARNVGLDNAKGEWITFVDSDDWLDKEFLESIFIDNIKSVDLVISYAKNINKNGKISSNKYQSRYINSNNIDTLFLENDFAWQTSPWAKLYKNELCKNIRFIENMHIGEDLIFLYTYTMKCNTIFILGENYYNYDISNENTLTRRIGFLEDELYAKNNIYDLLDKFISQKNIVNYNVIKKTNWIKSDYTHRVLNSLYHTPNISRKKRIEIIKTLDIENYVKHKGFNSKKEKLIRLILSKKMYCVYDLLRSIIVKTRS